MATLSQFQKAKFAYLFERFYDANKNGVITHSDFKDILRALQTLHGWTGDDKRLRETEGALNSAWVALKQGADINQDSKVTTGEWEAYWTGFIAKSAASADGWPADIPWVKDYMNFWFDLLDSSGDQLVDQQEFTKVTTHFGVPEGEALAAFKTFATQPVDRAYFAQLWLEYMTSDDKAAKGNAVFGCINW